MSTSFVYSIVLHLCLGLFMLMHFPSSPEELPQEKAIILDILDASRDLNLPNKPQQVKTEQPKEPKEQEQPEQPETIEAKQDTVNRTTSNSKEPIEELKQPTKDKNIDSSKQEKTKDIEQTPKEMDLPKENMPNTEKKVEPKPIEQTPAEQKPKEPKPVEQKSPTKPISKVDKKNEKKKSEDEWSNSVLKSLKSSTTKKKPKNIYDDIEEVNQAIKSHSKKKYDKQRPMTASQEAAIRSHVQKFWYVAPFSGGAGANDVMRVRVIVSLNAKGEVITVKTSADAGTRNKNYQAFLESAMRAVLDASPFPGLYKDQYDIWKDMEFTFDSSGMVQ